MKILLLLSLISLALFGKSATAKKVGPRPTYQLKTIYFEDVNNNLIKATPMENGLKIIGKENRPFIVEFFGNHCPPCLKTIPHLIELQKKYGDKIDIYAIEVQGLTPEEVFDFAQKQGINYHVSSYYNAYNLKQFLQEKTKWPGQIPFTVAFDKKGDARFAEMGMLGKEGLFKLAQFLIEGKNFTTKK